MPHATKASTPSNAPGQCIGNIIRQPSLPNVVPQHAVGQAKPSHGQPVDLTELSENSDAEHNAQHSFGVPPHHNENSLCCPHSTYEEIACTALFALPCCLPCWCGACHRLSNREEAAFYSYSGQPYAHASAPQQMWLCVNPYLHMETYSKNLKMIDLDEVKAADADGSPIVLSGLVTYTISNPWVFLTSGDVTKWVRNQGLVVMKEVASRYPYDASPGQVSLRTRGSRNVVVSCLKSEMQRRVRNVGLRIESFEFTDMHYAKEVAAQMLVTQQAKATLNARRIIVDGAVGIVTETVDRLQQVGIAFNPQQKADLVRSLLVMSVSDSPAQTTVAV